MLKPLLLSAALALSIPMTASAQAAMSAPPASDYVMKAGQSDQFEIKTGRLATQNASSPAVRRFGEEMVKDHTKSTKLVLAAAKKSGMAPPSAPPPLDADQQQMMDSLKSKTGKAFDTEYVSDQMKAHQAALSLQQSYADGGSDPNFQMAAKKIVPVVKKHIAMLDKMSSSGGAGM